MTSAARARIASSQSKIVEFCSWRRMRCMRRRRSSGDIDSAAWIAATKPSMLNGLMRIAPSISSAEPANLLSSSTPRSSSWLATNSLATRFIPS